ncbi:hypothetical protein BJX61DRAFT_500952 [Aspergillus egyptiacus]|nr:hypothetical protein BJX61DRAFT_500952 [Aspergillus egyptiacus]
MDRRLDGFYFFSLSFVIIFGDWMEPGVGLISFLDRPHHPDLWLGGSGSLSNDMVYRT